jgi:predicted NAD/FAD-binding protein
MAQIGVSLQETEMSFSVTNHQLNLEYNGNSLPTLFAQKRNLFRPSFYGLIGDILRFNKAAKKRLASKDETGGTLNEYLDDMNMGKLFRDNYLLPMIAAIWSCSVRQAGQFPLNLLLRFLDNHGLLSISNRPQWYVLKGGSHAYIPALTAPFKDSLHLNSPVTKVCRQQDSSSIDVITNHGVQSFDHVVMACHSDQALKILEQPTSAEQQVLGDIRYQMNEVILHSDTRVMPKRQLAWASWNFLAARSNDDALPCVTYSMNILQGIKSAQPLLVSLNAGEKITEHKIIQRFQYAHPIFSNEAVLAQ